MKSYKNLYLIALGSCSLLIFGLLISQLVLSLLHVDYVKWSFSIYLANNPVLLCASMGLVAGICEELGYTLVFSKIIKDDFNFKTPLYFAIGRTGLESIFNMLVLFFSGQTFFMIFFILLTRVVASVVCLGFTYLDYISAHKVKLKFLCTISIVLHAFMNGGILAIQTKIFPLQNINEDTFMLILSCSYILLFVCLFLFLRYKKVIL